MKETSTSPEAKKGFFRKAFDRIASPTPLKILAVGIAVTCIFSPIGFALGVASTVFSFASIAYGVYSDTKRMRETRKLQKELATLTEIDAIADGMREISARSQELAAALSSVIPAEKTTSSEKSFPKVKQSAYECVKKIPEFGFCLVVTLATQNVAAAVFSGATWMMSIFNGGVDNVSYAEKLHKAEDRCFQLASNQGFSYVLGSKDERLAQILQQKRENYIALKIVKNELTHNPDLNIAERFFEVRNQVHSALKKQAVTEPQPESWLNDLKTVLFDKGWSAEEGNKLYMPEHIPPQFDGIIEFTKNDKRIAEIAEEYHGEIVKQSTTTMEELGSPHHRLINTSNAIGHGI